MEINQIRNENCLVTMGQMQDNLIDLVVTSPPYDEMRDYDPDNPPDFDFYAIAGELCRVLAEGGVIVWVVADQTKDGDESGNSFRQALHFKDDLGLKLNTMIYEKQCQGAKGSNNFYWKVTEWVWILSKGKPKTINLIKDRENMQARGADTVTHRQADGSLKHMSHSGYGKYGRRTNVWTYPTGNNKTTKDKVAWGHPAMFPEALAEDHILSWSDEGDLVYDPFMGSGTVAKMASLNGRNWLGSEISAEYCDIARERLKLLEQMKETEQNENDLTEIDETGFFVS